MLQNWPKFSKKELNKVTEIIRSNKVNYWTGNEGKKFENEFARYFKLKHAIAIANGSLGLECALKAINIKENDEVIVPSKSYMSSASSVVNVGGKVIFADINLISHNITLNEIKKKITKKTKAIICVHLGGYPSEIDKIKPYLKKKKIKIIEDCSQAHGAKIKDKYVGSFGDISVWSFCNDKIISTLGEGGMIATNSYKYYKKIWSLKEIGKNKIKYINNKQNNYFQYLHDFFGTNLRMTEVQAAVGRIQLKNLKNNIFSRNIVAKKIISSCSKFIKISPIPKIYKHAYYRFYLNLHKIKFKKNWNVKKIIKELNTPYMICNTGSCSEIYLEKNFKKLKMIPKKRLKNAKILSKNSIAFFTPPTYSENEISYIQKKIESVFFKSIKV
jgi:dTDP-4-amino-4,6-dideoxygalactose transaminase